MSDKTYIQLSVFGLIYLAILFVTMVATFIPITIWWLFTGHMVSNILFAKVSIIITTTIFLVSVIIGRTSNK